MDTPTKPLDFPSPSFVFTPLPPPAAFRPPPTSGVHLLPCRKFFISKKKIHLC